VPIPEIPKDPLRIGSNIKPRVPFDYLVESTVRAVTVLTERLSGIQ